DIFGSQALPSEPAAADDALPTFVSAPNSDNPEESVELAPPAPAPEPTGDTMTISFEELFSGNDAPSAPAPAPAPPAPEPASSGTGEVSIEDALAATLSAMQEESSEPPAPAEPATVGEDSGSGESLDERSERMF